MELLKKVSRMNNLSLPRAPYINRYEVLHTHFRVERRLPTDVVIRVKPVNITHHSF